MAEIALEMLEDMFRGMRDAKWNTAGPLLWGYFFTDPDPSKLRAVGEYLARQGYRVADVFSREDGGTTFLHVEKIETHSPESLQARNAEFNAVAEQFGIESYDGMDVGQPTATPHA